MWSVVSIFNLLLCLVLSAVFFAELSNPRPRMGLMVVLAAGTAVNLAALLWAVT